MLPFITTGGQADFWGAAITSGIGGNAQLGAQVEFLRDALPGIRGLAAGATGLFDVYDTKYRGENLHEAVNVKVRDVWFGAQLFLAASFF